MKKYRSLFYIFI